MKFMFSEDDSVASVYGLALRVLREIEVEERDGTARCRCCAFPKSAHLPDDRCSLSALSRRFLNDRCEDRNAASKALNLIEQLRAL